MFGASFLQLSDFVSEPRRMYVLWVPDVFGEVGGSFVDVDVVDELSVQMGVPEGPLGHKLVIEVPRIGSVLL